jgi:hypothetical protein
MEKYRYRRRRAERRGTTVWYRINDQCVACFPTAADIVMGRPAPGAPAR